MPSAYLQWRFHSGERVVARGPLVYFILFYFSKKRRHDIPCELSAMQTIRMNLSLIFYHKKKSKYRLLQFW